MAGRVPADPDTFVEALAVTTPGLLPVAKSLLEEADVPYFIKNEETQGLFGWGQMGAGFNFITGPPVIMVHASRLAEVQELLQPLSSESAPSGDAQED